MSAQSPNLLATKALAQPPKAMLCQSHRPPEPCTTWWGVLPRTSLGAAVGNTDKAQEEGSINLRPEIGEYLW